MCTEEYKADSDLNFDNLHSKWEVIYNDLKHSFG